MTSEKKPTGNKKRGKYDEKLAVNGGFLDIMKAAAKNANDKSEEKRSNKD
ncbi:MAG: hypothetical protein JKX84_04015 [Flavobacteriales bacterium]|nr:hypothetical protein [Flavobacteriales bacterium]